MTPKEKAQELYLKYKIGLNIQHDMRPGANPFAKQCALICVEEILNVVSSDESAIIVELQYWKEVKTEIEKL